jgi:selenocysteine lyase/cysteine desulfurase
MIYFDNAATSFPKPESVYEALDYANRNIAFNAGRGSHKGAKEAQRIIDKLKEELSLLVGVNHLSNNIHLYESATIASNVLIFGLGITSESVIYLSTFEHNAISRPIELLRKRVDCKVRMIPFDNSLNLKEEDFKHMLSLEPADYVFVTAVSNVLGNIVDAHKVIELCKSSDPLVILDVAQGLGLIPIDFKKYDCDYMIFASHKTLYGPLGLGGIISKKSIQLMPYLAGGTGKDSLNTDVANADEIGSPNIVAVYGLLKSIEWIKETVQNEISVKVFQLAKMLADRLKQIDRITIYGNYDKDKHTGIVSFNHAEYSSQELAQILDQDYDIAIRGGYQCAPYIHKLLDTEKDAGVVRVSLGYFNNESEIYKLGEALEILNEY